MSVFPNRRKTLRNNIILPNWFSSRIRQPLLIIKYGVYGQLRYIFNYTINLYQSTHFLSVISSNPLVVLQIITSSKKPTRRMNIEDTPCNKQYIKHIGKKVQKKLKIAILLYRFIDRNTKLMLII
jgi:hypothetical protein